jgi:large subunit ribosomal protein L9
VRRGFGRNYLIPQGKALLATTRSVSQLEHERKMVATRAAKVAKEATAVAARIESVVPTVTKRAGDSDRLYGSVTNRDIANALEIEGVEIDRRRIELAEPIKRLGVYDVTVRLTSTITATTKLWVVSDTKSREVLEAEAAERERKAAEAVARAAEEAARKAEEEAAAAAEDAAQLERDEGRGGDTIARDDSADG